MKRKLLARKITAESVVLLKNEDSVLIQVSKAMFYSKTRK